MTSALAGTRRRAMRALIPPPRLPLTEWIEAEMRLPEACLPFPAASACGRISARSPTPSPIRRLSASRWSSRSASASRRSCTGALASYVANEPSPILCFCRPRRTPATTSCQRHGADLRSDAGLARHCSAPKLTRRAQHASEPSLPRRVAEDRRREVAAQSPPPQRRASCLSTKPTPWSPARKARRSRLPSGARSASATARSSSAARRSSKRRATCSAPMRSRTCASSKCRAPSAAAFHEITWADIQWEPDRPETAHYVCPHCGAVIEERHKAGDGRIRPTGARPRRTSRGTPASASTRS